MNTPEDCPTVVLNELFEKYVEPMQMDKPTFNAETVMSGRTNEIDLKRFPELKPEYDEVPTGYACWDGNSYDGPGSPVGWGALKIDALSDLIEQIEEARKPRRAGRVTHSSPFEPPTIVDEPQSDPDLDAGYEP